MKIKDNNLLQKKRDEVTYSEGILNTKIMERWTELTE